MKILFISNLCGYMGGVEQYIADIGTGLAARGHELFLAYFDSGGRANDAYAGLFRGCQRLEKDQDGEIDPEQFRTFLDSIRPDVVFVHKIDRAGRLIAAGRDYPLVRMVHDHDLCCPRKHKYFAWNSRICERPFGPACFADLAFMQPAAHSRLKVSFRNLFALYDEMKRNRRFDRLLVGSSWMRKELVCNGFKPEKIRIQPPVVNLPKIEYRPPADNGRILYVGQLIRGKGVDLLIRALALVKNDFSLKIIGEGNARESLSSLIREMGLEKKIELCGWVDRANLAEFYRECLFTVVPSRWPEPFGMVGLEAMSFGRAVAGFSAGGIPDWLRHNINGLLAPAGDCRGLSDMIQQLLSAPDQTVRMGMSGLKMIESEFSFSRSLSLLEEVFAEVINEKHQIGNKPKGRGSC